MSSLATFRVRNNFYLNLSIFLFINLFTICLAPTEGDNRKEKEQELKTLMKRLEAKYAALQVVPVISKLGTPQVGTPRGPSPVTQGHVMVSCNIIGMFIYS